MLHCVIAGADTIQSRPRKLKITILYSQKFHRTKVPSSENEEKGHFSGPACIDLVYYDLDLYYGHKAQVMINASKTLSPNDSLALIALKIYNWLVNLITKTLDKSTCLLRSDL